MFQVQLFDDQGDVFVESATGETLQDFANTVVDPTIEFVTYPNGSVKSFRCKNTIKYSLYEQIVSVVIRVNGRMDIATRAVPNNPSLWNIDLAKLEVIQGRMPSIITIVPTVVVHQKYHEVFKFAQLSAFNSQNILQTINTKNILNHSFVEGARVPDANNPVIFTEANSGAVREMHYTFRPIEGNIELFDQLDASPFLFQGEKASERQSSLIFRNKLGYILNVR